MNYRGRRCRSDEFGQGFPALADAALRAFPGAVVRGCRDIEMNTNRDDKRVSGMASNGPGGDKTRK